MTLDQLILMYRRGRTNDDLAHDSARSVSSSRWSQLSTGNLGARPLGRIPEVVTLKGVAHALGLPTFRVLVAAAASLGIDPPQEQSPLVLALAGLPTHLLNADDVEIFTRLVDRVLCANRPEAIPGDGGSM